MLPSRASISRRVIDGVDLSNSWGVSHLQAKEVGGVREVSKGCMRCEKGVEGAGRRTHGLSNRSSGKYSRRLPWPGGDGAPSSSDDDVVSLDEPEPDELPPSDDDEADDEWDGTREHAPSSVHPWVAGAVSAVGEYTCPPPFPFGTRDSDSELARDGRRGPPEGSLRERVRRWKGEWCDSSRSEPASDGGMCVCVGGGCRRNDVRRDEAGMGLEGVICQFEGSLRWVARGRSRGRRRRTRGGVGERLGCLSRAGGGGGRLVGRGLGPAGRVVRPCPKRC